MTRSRPTEMAGGDTFGRLTAVRPAGKSDEGAVLWLFRCECGEDAIRWAAKVMSGHTKSCGCLARVRWQDLAGERFGRLVALERVGPTPDGGSLWLCQCDCGEVPQVRAQSLKRGATVSCGCYHDTAPITHGMWGNPLFSAWSNMMSRCNNPSNPAYRNYGGRGIEVCERWHDPKVFADDLIDLIGERPSAEYSLDRVNNDGNYEPGNVRWATATQQARNRRPRSEWVRSSWSTKKKEAA